MPVIDPTRYRKPRMPLGRWLLRQQARADQVGRLADAARRDTSFPADGDYSAISARLNQAGADAEMHDALDEAALDWSNH